MAKIAIDWKKYSKQVTIAAIVVGIVVLLLYVNLLLKPQVMKLFDNAVNITKMTVDVRNAEADIDKVGKYRRDIELYKDKITRYEKMLPAEQEIPSFLENLARMARSSNVKIIAITPVVKKEEAEQPNQIYQEIPILINAKSGYHELGRFLASLEGSDRFMKVVDINIRTNNSTPKKHDVELLVLTYILLKYR